MSKSKSLKVSGLGVAVGIIGSFLPWYSYELFEEAITFKAMETSTGKLLLVLFLLAGLFAFLGDKKGSKGMQIGLLIMGLFAFLVVMANNPADAPFDGLETMYGYWLSLVGGIMAVAGGVMGLMKKKK